MICVVCFVLCLVLLVVDRDSCCGLCVSLCVVVCPLCVMLRVVVRDICCVLCVVCGVACG